MIRTLIYASAKDGAIGKGGGLPWDLPADLAHFRRLTSGHAVIMGRVTAESIMARFNGQLLPKRSNIVVSSTLELEPGIGRLSQSLDEAWALAEQSGCQKAYVIGGRKLYEEAIEQVDFFDHTDIDARVPDADTFFAPTAREGSGNKIDRRLWRCIHREIYPKDDANIYSMRFERWKKIS